jgi:hypothetical protein
MLDTNLILHGVEIVLLLGVLIIIFPKHIFGKVSKKHRHAWQRVSEEKTNRRLVGIYRCMTCGNFERRDEGVDKPDAVTTKPA